MLIRIAKVMICFFDLIGKLSIHLIRSSIQKQYAKKHFRQQLTDAGVPEEVINELTRSYTEMISLTEMFNQPKKKTSTSKGKNTPL